MINCSRDFKGQSAIEYLMTYGWMLLVVAIVGGAIFATIQDQTQIETTGGLANAPAQIDSFTTSADGLEMEVRGAGESQIEDVSVWVFVDGELDRDGFENSVANAGSASNFSVDDAEEGEVNDGSSLINGSITSEGEGPTIPIGDSEILSVEELSASENVNEFEIAFVYDMDPFEGQTSIGSIQGQIERDEENGE